jgi:hypothetical protein
MESKGRNLDSIVPCQRLLEPAQSGPFAGERLHPEKREDMRDEYYRANLWNLETGWQNADALPATGLPVPSFC